MDHNVNASKVDAQEAAELFSKLSEAGQDAILDLLRSLLSER